MPVWTRRIYSTFRLLSSSACCKCFISPAEVTVAVDVNRGAKSNAEKIVRAARAEQVHAAPPVVWVITSEKINRVDRGDVSGKRRTHESLEKFSAPGDAFRLKTDKGMRNLSELCTESQLLPAAWLFPTSSFNQKNISALKCLMKSR
ncbi:Uncharacterized protein DAT39_011034 [Clarias magur]|uniref:Uncharacterized protein n=1 Tax=Clarias magur TaxID=1594786 RepID=A0A8J4UGI1_CLAMG|nr:Uncharacterized protein DAT39_011034 [Clarias magur]